MSNYILWTLEEPQMAIGGDYGPILKYGTIENHDLDINGDYVYHYMRAVPYIPNINFLPSIIIVTDLFRKACEADKITGIRFIPVIIKRLVKIDWVEWTERTWMRPSKLFSNAGAEPESYFTHADNNAIVDGVSMKLWSIKFEKSEPLQAAIANAPVFIECHRGRYFSVNAAGKDWLIRRWHKEVVFEEFDIDILKS